MNRVFFSCVLLIFVTFSNALHEGEICETEDFTGNCVNIHKCNYSKRFLEKRKKPKLCGFQGRTPIMCCPSSSIDSESELRFSKSAIKCQEYHDHRRISKVYDGKPGEFPHMAILGCGEGNNIEWLCGGTLISEQFVLTAAHCLHSRIGNLTKIRLGDLNVESNSDVTSQDYEIADVFLHPDYNEPSLYNDIGLVKLKRLVEFNKYIMPACLHTSQNVNWNNFVTTGWGRINFLEKKSNHVLNVNLHYIDHEDCVKRVGKTRSLQNGVIDDIQICAEAENNRDSCPGDSGGPLQAKTDESISAVYYHLVGITSFGKACGFEKNAGVYTRIAPYIEWIENIVWP